MIAEYFNLREQPFGVTPDPKYMYPSASHREALAALLYGLQSGLGFVSLIAKPGMGKTTLLFEVLSKLRDTRTTVFLFQALTTPTDLLRAILIDLGVREVREDLVDLQTQLNRVLLNQHAAHKSVVVVIDEAQNLNDSVLETVRMLSNFETSSQKLMQIILAGQPQLAEKLMAPDLLQLRQRISIFAHLTPLSTNETATYIYHRLKFAGLEMGDPIFTPSALVLVARHSEGIPRNINNICFNAMSLAFALKRHSIDSEIVKEVISDLSVKEHLLSSESYPLEPVEDVPLELLVDETFFNFDTPLSNSDGDKLMTPPEHSIPTLGAAELQACEDHESFPCSQSVQNLSDLEATDPGADITSTNVELVDRPVFTDFGSHSGSSSDSGPWTHTAIVAVAFVTILCVWLGIADYRIAFPARVIQASSHVASALGSDDNQHADQPRFIPGPTSKHRGSIRVKKVESLATLCDSVYGKCTPELLEQLLLSNPSILYPNRLSPGQIIALPPDIHDAKTEK